MRKSRVFACVQCSFTSFITDQADQHIKNEGHDVKTFHEEFELPLRKCTVCGVEACHKSELDFFVKNAHSQHFRENLCKKCASVIKTEYIKGRIYKK